MRTDPRAAADVAWSPAPPQGVRLWADLGTIQAPDRLIRRLLGEGSLATIYGAPGSGKSFLSLAISLSIARGEACMGRRVLQGAVLYLCAEGGRGFENRVAADKAKRTTPADVPFAVMARALDLGPGGADADAVIEAAKGLVKYTRQPVRLIVIDTLNRCINGADENTAEAMGAFVANCTRIIEATGATILVVHHRGKDAARGMRGHSSLLGAVDTAIEVEKRESGRAAIVRKSKDTPDGEEIGFDLEVVDLGEDEDGEPITSCVVVPAEAGPASDSPRLSATERRTLDMLAKALEAAGEPPPSSRHIPHDCRVVRFEAWREYAYAGSVTSSDKPDSRRKAFGRAADNLIGKGLVGKWTDFVWLAR